MRPFWRTLFVAPTAPVDVILWCLALSWLATLAFTPDRAYAVAHVPALLQAKGLWVWPAVVAVLTPLIVRPNWHRAVFVLRCYQLAWWTFLALALGYLAPSFPAFWGVPAIGAVASVWLLVRSATRSHDAGTG